VWWSEFDWQLFTFLGAIEAMRFVWVAMVTGGLSIATNSFLEEFLHHDGERKFLLKEKALV
jgi:hypothetical protein